MKFPKILKELKDCWVFFREPQVEPPPLQVATLVSGGWSIKFTPKTIMRSADPHSYRQVCRPCSQNIQFDGVPANNQRAILDHIGHNPGKTYTIIIDLPNEISYEYHNCVNVAATTGSVTFQTLKLRNGEQE